MATAEILKEEHLTCSICYMPFTEPKTLQCLHTFCKECLQRHIDISNHFRGITCPVCRHVTTMTDPFQPRQKWAQLMKTDFKVAGILEALHEMEKAKGSPSGPIMVTTNTVPGNDRKTQLTTILKVLQPAISFIQGKIEDEKTSQTSMEETRATTEQEIRSFFGQMIDAIKVKQMKLLDDLSAAHEIGKKESEQNIGRFKDLVDETRDTIGLIDRLLSPGSEYATMECLPRIQKQQEQVMRFISDPPISTNPLTFTFKENVRNTQAMMHTLEFGTVSASSVKDGLPNGAVSDVWRNAMENQSNSDDSSCCKSEERRKSEASDGGARVPVPSRVPVPVAGATPDVPAPSTYSLQRTVATGLDEDSYVPLLKNIVILQGKVTPAIVVLDYDNASLKSFYVADGQMRRGLHRFSGYPQSIAKFAEDKVIVSLMNYKFVIFTADLKQVSSIESEKWYACMSTLITTEKLFGFVNTSTTTIIGGRLSVVEHLSVKGRPLNKIDSSVTENIFSEISHMCVAPNTHMVVCDSANREVVCLSQAGEVIWRVGHIDQEQITPGGVATDSNGNVFVVEKERMRVVKLSGEDRSVVEDVITRDGGLCDPLDLAIDSENKLYVTQQNGVVNVYAI